MKKRVYTVVLHAGQGAGKTMLLATIQRVLSITNANGLRIVLRGDVQKRTLADFYLATVTGQEWAPGTAGIGTYDFDVYVASPSATYHVLTIRFVDYPGEWMTNITSEELEGHLENADIVAGILDGAQVRRMMEGQGSATFMHKDVARICQALDRNGSPVHLFLTKWDVLSGYTLEQVLERLYEHDCFSRLVTSCNERDIPARLIPVSALGPGFAEMQPDGTMKKTGFPPQPFMVENTIACIIQDRIRAELARLVREQEDLEQRTVRVDPAVTGWDRFREGAGNLVRGLCGMLPANLRFADPLLSEIAQSLRRPLQQKQTSAQLQEVELRRQIQRQLRAVGDDGQALNHALRCFVEFERELERQFPACILYAPSANSNRSAYAGYNR